MLSSELMNVLLTLVFVRIDAQTATSVLAASSNPTYNGSDITLTCSRRGGNSVPPGTVTFSDNYLLKYASGNTTAWTEHVQCYTSNSTNVKSGLFTTSVISCDWQSLRVSFIAKVTFAGNYLCQVQAGNVGSTPSNVVSLKVYEAPSPPEIRPLLLTFNDSDPMLLECTSSNGDPPAEIELKLTKNAPIIVNYTATALNTVLLSLNASIALHEATAICQVKNHLLPKMTATSNIKINHIALRPGVNASQHAFENDMLDCSNLVDSFPPPVFTWSNLSASAFTIQASSGSFGPVGYSGILSCTATNNVIQKSVVVKFYIEKGLTTRLPETSSSLAGMQKNSSSEVPKAIASTPPSLSWTSEKTTSRTTISTTTPRFLSIQGSSVMTSITRSVANSTTIWTAQSMSWAPARTTDGTTPITMTQRSSSSQGSSPLTLLTDTVTNSAESLQRNEPIIIGVTVSVSLLLAAVVVTTIILCYCRKRTPSRNLPLSQSNSKIIGENQLSVSQGDNADDFMCMTDNDLYGSSPPVCAEYKSSIIYDEPNYRPSVSSTLLSTSRNKDASCISVLPHERNLPPSQSSRKIIGDNQLSESQGDNAEDFVCMTDNDLYGSSPPRCAEYKSSFIYDEPNYRPSANSILLSTSHNKDSPCLSALPHKRDLIAKQSIDVRPTASSPFGAIQDISVATVEHGECSAALGEVPYSTPPDVSATPIGTAAGIQANEPFSDPPMPPQSFTKGRPPHNRSFDNMAYMEIQLDVRSAPDDHLHEED